MNSPTISQWHEALLRGEVRLDAGVEACLSTIERYEPRLRAWVAVDAESARRQVQELAAALTAGQTPGPLAGIALGVKDIVDVAGFPTRAGSWLTSADPAPADAPVVARLRQAGAVILGKTVTTEFACFDPPPTRNPWNVLCTPGGSSSGSAVAVATGMCVAALGTQTGGSIIRPATYCGVCGIKPTLGSVSTRGVVPVSKSLDHVGCLARNIADLKTVWRVIADPVSSPTSPRPVGARRPVAPRLGVVESLLTEAKAEVSAAILEAIGRLRAAGARLVAVDPPTDFATLRDRHRTIMAYEAAEYHRRTYGTRRIGYGRNLQSLLDEGQLIAEPAYRYALECRRALGEELAAALARFDAWIMPAAGSAAPPPDTTGDAGFNSPWSLAGVPAVTLPCGMAESNRTPVGLQLVGRAHGEERLLDCALWCEQRLDFAPWTPQLLEPPAG